MCEGGREYKEEACGYPSILASMCAYIDNIRFRVGGTRVKAWQVERFSGADELISIQLHSC